MVTVRCSETCRSLVNERESSCSQPVVLLCERRDLRRSRAPLSAGFHPLSVLCSLLCSGFSPWEAVVGDHRLFSLSLLSCACHGSYPLRLCLLSHRLQVPLPGQQSSIPACRDSGTCLRTSPRVVAPPWWPPPL